MFSTSVNLRNPAVYSFVLLHSIHPAVLHHLPMPVFTSQRSVPKDSSCFLPSVFISPGNDITILPVPFVQFRFHASSRSFRQLLRTIIQLDLTKFPSKQNLTLIPSPTPSSKILYYSQNEPFAIASPSVNWNREIVSLERNIKHSYGSLSQSSVSERHVYKECHGPHSIASLRWFQIRQ